MRRTIGFLFDYVLGEFQSSMRGALERACAERDVHLVSFFGGALDSQVPEIAARNFVYSLVTPQRVDGVVIVAGSVGGLCGPARMQQLIDSFAPLPVCSLSGRIEGGPSLLVDNERGMQRVVEHMVLQHGYRRVAFVRGPATNGEAEARFRVYRETLQRYGLPLDEALVVSGDFEAASGAQAVATLVDQRRVQFDALVGANDNMAAGAISALLARKLRVPHDVAVIGFDDAPIASFAKKPLSSARQPFAALARAAVDTLLAQLEGRAVEPCRLIDVELVTRQSCGCGFSLQVPERHSATAPHQDALAVLRSQREQLVELVARELNSEQLDAQVWAERLLDALAVELTGRPGSMAAVLDDALASVEHEDLLAVDLQRAISTLRERLHDSPAPLLGGGLEPVWQRARVTISVARARVERERKMNLLAASSLLQASAEAISNCLEHEALASTLARTLPQLGIRTAYICQFTDAQRRALLPRLCLRDGEREAQPLTPFPPEQLGPSGVFAAEARYHRLVLPLSTEEEAIGIAVFEASGASSIVYESMRDQIGGALRVITLHERVLAAVAERERAERGRLSNEVEISSGIRAALRPRQVQVDGLDLGLFAGGHVDRRSPYLDILRAGSRSWFALGSISHGGLATSLVLLMLQSAVSTLVIAQPGSTPEELQALAQRVLAKNVERRLQSGEEAQFGLLRFDPQAQGGKLLGSTGLGAIAVAKANRKPYSLEPSEQPEIELAAGDLVLVSSVPWSAFCNRAGEPVGEAIVHNQMARRRTASSQHLVDELCGELAAAGCGSLQEVALLAARVLPR